VSGMGGGSNARVGPCVRVVGGALMEPKDAIRVQVILAGVTIWQLLDEFRVRYASKTTQQILCPVHKDRTPSARVYAEGNRVYCFTCAKQWDVIALVRDKEGLDFGGALDWLETRFLVPPASANLGAVLKASIRRKAEMSPEPLYTLVESRLIVNRERLGLIRYTKGLLALDLLFHQVKTRAITNEDFAAQARAILEYAGR
jgi:CHC2-type zinc finger protein